MSLLAAVPLILSVTTALPAAQPDGSWRDDGEWRAWRTNAPAAPGLRAVEVEAGGRRFAAWVDDHALVRVGPDGERVLAEAGLRVVRAVMPAIGLVLVEDATGRGDDGLALAARLAPLVAAGRLARATPDLWLNHRLLSSSIPLPPNDPHYPAQWFWARLKMEEIWKRETGSPTQTIVVVDNGCDARHPDLMSKLDVGYDALDGDNDPSPVPSTRGNNHGTACAGLVGAAGGNGVGVIGGCPDCRVRCVRLIADSMQPIPLSADTDAFQFALDNNAAVVSNSWGFVDPVPAPGPLADAIITVENESRGGRGAVVLFAAGNDDRELLDNELTGVEGVITVGAVNQFGDLAPFSNRGRTVDLVAPTGTYTTDISGADGENATDYTDLFGGTSSACPVAAGVAGLLASAAPDAKASDISAALIGTAKLPVFAVPGPDGHDLQYGFGEIKPAAALERLVPTPAPMMPKGGCSCDVGRRSDGEGVGLTIAVLLALALLRPRRDGETLRE